VGNRLICRCCVVRESAWSVTELQGRGHSRKRRTGDSLLPSRRTPWTRKKLTLPCVLRKLDCEFKLGSFAQDLTATAESISVVRIGG